MEVGIVGSATDLHTEVVRWALGEGGIDCRVIDTLRGADLYEGAALSIDDDEAARGGIVNRELRALWYRRHHKVRPFSPDPRDENEAFRTSERNIIQENIVTALSVDPAIGWVNNPRMARVAESKFVQLAFAREAGLRIPATLMTASPEQIRAFARRYPEIVVKPFGVYAWEYADRRRTFAMASKVDSSRIIESSDGALSNTPAIYQSPIGKKSDLRVVVIGEDVFAYNVIQKGEPDFDCRFSMSNPDRVRLEPYPLREDQKAQVLGLLRVAGIDMASADFALTPDEEIVFLDLNPAGAWLFLEDAIPTISLTRRLCRLLSARAGLPGRPDFPSYADFRRSGAAAAFRNRYVSERDAGATINNDRTWSEVA